MIPDQVSVLHATFKGRLRIYKSATCPSLDQGWPTPVLDKPNLVVDTAQDMVLGLLKRQFTDYAPAYIVLGSGGDLEQVSKQDFCARVAPAVSDTSVRAVVARLPIIQITPDPDDETSWDYITIARPHEANTTALNELGLETANNTLISHVVTDPESGQVRAQKFVKSSLEYLVVRWTMTFTLS